MQDVIGNVFRHNRLFNYLAIPLKINEHTLECQIGKDYFLDLPLEYFERDWHIDSDINGNELKTRILDYADKTPFTIIYDLFYEVDDGKKHSFIHFNDDFAEKMVRFPLWHLTTCTKSQRDKLINPFTMIMPVIDGHEKEIQSDLDIMNDIRKSNELIKIDDFQGFEFGLIKYLEKKYLRNI